MDVGAEVVGTQVPTFAACSQFVVLNRFRIRAVRDTLSAVMCCLINPCCLSTTRSLCMLFVGVQPWLSCFFTTIVCRGQNMAIYKYLELSSARPCQRCSDPCHVFVALFVALPGLCRNKLRQVRNTSSLGTCYDYRGHTQFWAVAP